MQTAYFNGEFLARDDVRVSPDDRGFLFSDGVYEVLRAYGGRLFEVERHVDRLAYSLAAMRIRGVSASDLAPVFEELLQRNDLSAADALVYLQVTRGAAPRTHRYPDPPVPPTVYAYAWAFSPDHVAVGGERAIMVPDQRWARCDIKTVQLLPNVLAKQQAVEAGAFDALFVSDENVVREGTSSNVFIAAGGRLLTHPLTPRILPGITRQVILDLCGKLRIPAEERYFTREELYGADEAFLSGTVTEVLPITRVDGTVIGDGKAGPLTARLYDELRGDAGAESRFS
jgi:D-alanine transaminase